VLEGRVFDARDDADGEQVAVVSRALAERYWPDGDALGGRLKVWGADSDEPWRTVIGVVGDVRHNGPGQEEPPIFYLPLAQWPQPGLTLVVRGADQAPPAPALVDTVRAVAPGQPVYDVRLMREWVDASVSSERFLLLLLTAFGVTALSIAALGLYGVMSFTVAARTREFGVRLALGATSPALIGLAVGHGLVLAAAGLALGLAGSVVAGHSIAAAVPRVEPLSLPVYAGAAAVLMTVALAASVVPANRVHRVDPLTTLRAE